ncbi:MAG: BON domain-containing protein [Candidatus Binataceae bacterium]|nr:BON domain-containing protein [Candidatus Binataceae bacterium]
MMKSKLMLKLALPMMAVALGTSGIVFAQSASESMSAAGHDTAAAASHAWHGTKTAVKDTDITSKVKMHLHGDKLTKGQDIHVDTVNGMVTLSGSVSSSGVSAHAVRVARDTEGVRGVKNDLRISSANAAD